MGGGLGGTTAAISKAPESQDGEVQLITLSEPFLLYKEVMTYFIAPRFPFASWDSQLLQGREGLTDP